jgi:trk system potassium uptake protein TrkH
MMRILVLSKVAYFAVYHWFRPHAVVATRMGGVKVKEETIQGILGFFVLFMGLFVGCSLIMSLLGLDLVTATSSVVAALGNIGPGLGLVGPVLNYADVPAAGKLVLSFCMLLGRLELFTVMVLLVPSFWRR